MVLDYRSPAGTRATENILRRSISRWGFAPLLSFACDGVAIVFGVGACVASKVAGNGFLDILGEWGIASIVLLLGCYGVALVALVAGIVGVFGAHRDAAANALCLCLLLVAVVTVAFGAIGAARPMGGAPG